MVGGDYLSTHLMYHAPSSYLPEKHHRQETGNAPFDLILSLHTPPAVAHTLPTSWQISFACTRARQKVLRNTLLAVQRILNGLRISSHSVLLSFGFHKLRCPLKIATQLVR